MMDHPRLDELWLDFAEGQMSPEEARSFRAHLDICSDCGPRYRELASVHQLSRSIGRQIARDEAHVPWWDYPKRVATELLLVDLGIPASAALGVRSAPSKSVGLSDEVIKGAPRRRRSWTLLATAAVAAAFALVVFTTHEGRKSGDLAPSRETRVSTEQHLPAPAFALRVETAVVHCPDGRNIVALLDVEEQTAFVLRFPKQASGVAGAVHLDDTVASSEASRVDEHVSESAQAESVGISGSLSLLSDFAENLLSSLCNREVP